jgi:hypothetical protein
MASEQSMEIANMASQAPVAQMDNLQLTPSDLYSPEVDPSFYVKNGVILQFINSNCAGQTTLIGGLRLALADIRKVPAYIHRNRSNIKYYAVKCLDRHMRFSQCSIGLGETLALDDYGMSCSIATLSQRAMELNPMKRSEGPLFYSALAGFVDPIFVGHTNGNMDDFAHVVNVFIHLLPPTQRRSACAIKAVQDASQQATNPNPGPTPPFPGYGKRAKGNPGHQGGPRSLEHHKVDERLAHLEREVQAVKGLQLPNPPLPATAGPAPPWKHDGNPALPDDL